MPLRVKSGVIWCNKTSFPLYYGYVPDEKAWKKEMMRLGLPHEPYPKTYGSTKMMDRSPKASECVLVTLSNDLKARPIRFILSVLMHEAVHVWQFMCRQVGETDPGWEQEAYTIQFIFEELFDAYMMTLPKARRKAFNEFGYTERGVIKKKLPRMREQELPIF